MPREFILHLDGEVGGKGRPRTRIISTGGKPFATIYPDPESAKMEKLIKGLAFAKMAGRPLWECPVELTIEVFLNQPPSWSKAKRAAASGYFATVKPDVDNVAKLICDAFNKTVWLDDTQVADLVVRRRYTDHKPSVVVTVKELVRPDSQDDLLNRT